MNNENLISFNTRLNDIEHMLSLESLKTFPTIYILERASNQLSDLINEMDYSDEKFHWWKKGREMSIEIFDADLIEIEDDYRKKLKRYKGKWDQKKRDLENIILRTKEVLGERGGDNR